MRRTGHAAVTMIACAAALFSAAAVAGDSPKIRAISSSAPVYSNRPGAQLPAPARTTLIRAIGTSSDRVLASDRKLARSQPSPPELPPSGQTGGMPGLSLAQPQQLDADALVMRQALDRRLVSLAAPAPSPPRAAAPPLTPARQVVPIAQYQVATYAPAAPKRLYPLTTYQSQIQRASRTHGVDEALVRAVIHAESSYKPNAVSHVGAGGLMQLMPQTARRFGVSNRFDVAQNIEGGTRYLAWLLDRYNGNVTLATAAYNAGEGAVDRYKGVPPYRETLGYVRKVGSLLAQYRGLLGGSYSPTYAATGLAFSVPPAYARGVRAISGSN